MTEAVRDSSVPERGRAQRRRLRGTLRQRRAGHGLRAGQRGQGVPGVRHRRGREVPGLRREGEALGRLGVEIGPVSSYRGPFSWEAVEEHTYGPTTMCPPDAAGRFGGREGCVITPVIERYHAGLGDSGG